MSHLTFNKKTIMKTFKKSHVLLAIMPLIIFASACKKDEQIVSPPLPGNEYLTTVTLRLTNINNPNDTVIAIWRDLTPDDISAPDTSLALLNLKDSSIYQTELLFTDETKSPAEDITSEIQERGNYHRIFYLPSANLSSNLTINITDLDTNSPPLAIGISSTIQTFQSSSGSLRVVLKHQPNVKDGTFDPGSIDTDVNFQVIITQ
jgi:hypothetical protein